MRLEEFFTLSNDVLAVFGPDGRFERVNPAIERLLGYSADELRALPPLALVHPDDRAAIPAAGSAFDAAEQGYHIEVRYRHKSGQYRWLDWTGAPRSADGRRYASARDITDRKRMQQEAEAHALQQAALSNLSRLALAATETDGLLEAATRLACEALAADLGAVLEIGGEQQLAVRAAVGFPSEMRGLPIAEASLGGYAIARGATVVSPDLAAESRFPRSAALARIGACSGMATPLQVGGGLFGVMEVFTPTPRSFTLEEATFFASIASVLSSALERDRVVRALRESEERYRRIFEDSSDGIYQTDGGSRFALMNTATAHMLGYDTPEEAIAAVSDISDLYVDPDRRAEILTALATHGKVEGEEFRLRRRDGSIAYLSINARLIDDGRGGSYICGISSDVTAEHEAREALKRSEEQYRRIVESTSEGIWTIAADTTTTFVNARMAAMLGYTREQMIGRPLRAFVDREGWEHARRTLARRGDADAAEHDYRLLRADGAPLWVRVSTTPLREQGAFVGALALVRDVTELREAREYKHRALHDPLTGLPNRVLFGEHLEQALRDATRRGEPLSVMQIDLDGFKSVNDSHGHQTGDLLLQQVAERLRAAVRESDMVARLGGDEFCVLLPNTDARRAHHVAEKLIAAVRKPVAIADGAIAVGLSAGIAAFPHHGHSAPLLLHRADAAMYAAKRRHGGAAVWTVAIEARLARAS